MKKRFGKLHIEFSLRPTRTIFRVLLVILAVILVWWGMWKLLDHYFFPHHPMLGAVLAILIGFITLYLPDKDLKDLLS